MFLGRSQVPVPQNEINKTYAPNSPERSEVVASLDEFKKSSPIEIPLIIGTKKIFTKKKDAIFCPHEHQRTIAFSSHAGKHEAEQAIVAGLKARKDWAALTFEDRAAVFLKAAELLATKYRAKMNAATMLGQSKTVHQAEIDASCELIDFFNFNVFFAQKILEDQPKSSRGVWNQLAPRGLEGFVYAIAPFNFTSISINLACAPALMGCTVIWKPASTAVLSSYIGYQILEEAGLPPGVIQFLPGNSTEISASLLQNENLNGIHFTGSTSVFNMLWKATAENLERYRSYPRLVGETGGKDFVFAHESADPKMLTTALIRGAFEYQGQKCSAASRAYIPKNLWAKIRKDLTDSVENIAVGDPADFKNFMGAVIDEKAFKKITEYIATAKKSSSAKIIAGGESDSRVGYFIKPTVIETTDPYFITMKEEIFGPVLTVYVYDETKFDETLAICNNTSPYALTGAIFACDRHTISHMAGALEDAAGNFYINDKPTGAVVGQQPFGGSRKSGTNDKAGSVYNLTRWVSHRTIKENFSYIDSYQYPYMGV